MKWLKLCGNIDESNGGTETFAMEVPGGVIVKDVTLMVTPNQVLSTATVFVPGVELERTPSDRNVLVSSKPVTKPVLEVMPPMTIPEGRKGEAGIRLGGALGVGAGGAFGAAVAGSIQAEEGKETEASGERVSGDTDGSEGVEGTKATEGTEGVGGQP